MISVDVCSEFFTKFKAGVYPNMRLGQAFCNEFRLTDAELYYCENEDLAMLIIQGKYQQ